MYNIIFDDTKSIISEYEGGQLLVHLFIIRTLGLKMYEVKSQLKILEQESFKSRQIIGKYQN